jgi:methyl-galactoside transport system substrate-binding protein
MKQARALAATLAAAALLPVLAAGCSDSKMPRIGVALYRVDDAFISTARRALEAQAQGKARLSIMDAQNQERIQAAQIDAMVSDKADVIILNPVDRISSAATRAFRAKSAGIPMVFFNREPPATAIKSWEKIYYVGAHTEEADGIQAEMLVDYCKNSPAADRDGNGVIEYFVLRGDSSLIDADARDAYREQVLEASGLVFAKVDEATANWSRSEAQQKTAALIERYGKGIEAILCDNDEMALGAIVALKVAGYLKGNADFVPVLGIDATAFALEAINEGSLLGTVRGDAAAQGRNAFGLAYDIATGKDLSSWGLKDGHYLYIPFQKVTRANVGDFK